MFSLIVIGCHRQFNETRKEIEDAADYKLRRLVLDCIKWRNSCIESKDNICLHNVIEYCTSEYYLTESRRFRDIGVVEQDRQRFVEAMQRIGEGFKAYSDGVRPNCK